MILTAVHVSFLPCSRRSEVHSKIRINKKNSCDEPNAETNEEARKRGRREDAASRDTLHLIRFFAAVTETLNEEHFNDNKEKEEARKKAPGMMKGGTTET